MKHSQERRGLRLWDVARPILRFLYNRASPKTKKEINKLSKPCLNIARNIRQFVQIPMLLIALFIFKSIWVDVYYNQAEYNVGSEYDATLLLILLGFIIIIFAIILLLNTKELLLKLLKGVYTVYVFYIKK